MPHTANRFLEIDITKISSIASERLKSNRPTQSDDKPEVKTEPKPTWVPAALTPTLFSLNHPNPDLLLEDFIEKTLLQMQIKNIIVLRDLNPLHNDMRFWMKLTNLRIGKFLSYKEYQLIADRQKHTYLLKNINTSEQHTFTLHFFSYETMETSFARLLKLYKTSLEDNEKLLIDACKNKAADSLALSFLIFELFSYFGTLHSQLTTTYKRTRVRIKKEEILQLSHSAANLVAEDIVKIVQSLRVSQPEFMNDESELQTAANQACNLFHYAILEKWNFKRDYPHLCHFRAFQSFFHRLAYRFFYPATNPLPPVPVDNNADDLDQQSFWRCCS